MKGKTSIKYVLPAVWNNNSYLWEIDFLRGYVSRDQNGNLLSPYEGLPAIDVGGSAQVVKAGTDAMKAYQEMMFGASRGDAGIKQRWADLLLQYCKLDTLAMVIIWMHWNYLLTSRR